MYESATIHVILLAALATMVGDLFAERLEAVFAQWAGLSLRDAHRAQALASFHPFRAMREVLVGGETSAGNRWLRDAGAAGDPARDESHPWGCLAQKTIPIVVP